MMNKVGFGEVTRVFAENSDECSACGALYKILDGKKTDMLFHGINSKVLYVSSGKVKLSTIIRGTVRNVLMEAGQSLVVPPLMPHRLEAYEGDAKVIEFGTERGAYKAVDGNVMNPMPDTRVIESGSQVVEPDSEAVEESIEPISVKVEAEKPKPKRRRRKKKSQDDN